MDKKKAKKYHTEEFKHEAVELAKRIGFTKAGVELGVHATSIRTWNKKINGQDKPASSPAQKKSYSDLEKEVKRLAKENGYLKEINKVLKKSTAIFSADQMGGSR